MIDANSGGYYTLALIGLPNVSRHRTFISSPGLVISFTTTECVGCGSVFRLIKTMDRRAETDSGDGRRDQLGAGVRKADALYCALFLLAKQAKRFQRPLFWYAFERKRCRDEKSRTAPKKGIRTHAAFASGTTGICLSPLSFPFQLSLLSLSLSCPAYASAGRMKVTATKTQTLRR